MEIKAILTHYSNHYPTLCIEVDPIYREKLASFKTTEIEDKYVVHFNGLYFRITNKSFLDHRSCLVNPYLPKQFESLILVSTNCGGRGELGLFQKEVIEKLIKENDFPLAIDKWGEIKWAGETYPFDRQTYDDVFFSRMVFPFGEKYAARSWYRKSIGGFYHPIELGNEYPNKESAINAINEFAKTGILKRFDDPTKYLDTKSL